MRHLISFGILCSPAVSNNIISATRLSSVIKKVNSTGPLRRASVIGTGFLSNKSLYDISGRHCFLMYSSDFVPLLSGGCRVPSCLGVVAGLGIAVSWLGSIGIDQASGFHSPL